MTTPADCPLAQSPERRRFLSRVRPFVDIARIAFYIAATHLVFRLVQILGTLYTSVLEQNEMLHSLLNTITKAVH